MNFRKAALPALALAVGLSGAAGLNTLSASQAFAQASTAPAPADQQMKHHERHAFTPGRHLEGRIAYLRAELKITDAQAPAFDKVAQAMRENSQALAGAMQKMRGNRDQPRSAVEHLEARAEFDKLRVQSSERFLAAFKPLYDSLSPDQKKSADELLASHHHRHRA
jgi:protein CpxP